MADQPINTGGEGFTVVDLGQALKQRHPGVYNSFSDADLGRAYREKHMQAFGGVKDIQEKPPAEDLAPPPTATERFLKSAKGPLDPTPVVKLAGSVASSPFRGKEAMKQAGQDLHEAFVQPANEMLQKSSESLREGNLLDWVGYSMAAGLPGLGPSVMHGYEQMKKGDVAGGLGTWAGTLASIPLGEGVFRGAGKLAGARRSVAANLYKSGLKFDEGTSLPMRREIAERGLGRPVPPGSPPPEPVTGNEAGMGKLLKRSRETHREVLGEVDKATQSGKTMDLNYILDPLDRLAAEVDEVSPSMAKPLRNLADDWRNKHVQYLTPNKVQQLKQGVDRVINDKAFAEDAKLTGATAGLKTLRDRMQSMLEDVAPVNQPNRAISLDLKLADAINTALKNKPSIVHELTPWVLGEAALNTFSPGSGMVGAEILAGGLVRAGIRRPEVMTRLGIMLDRAKVPVPAAVSKLAAKTPGRSSMVAPAGVAASNASRRREINLQSDRVITDILGLMER